MPKQQWVIEERLVETSDVDWDTFVIGVVEDGMFLEHFRTNEKQMAIFAVNVFEWYETFEEGIIQAPEKVIEKIKVQISKKKPQRA